MIFHLHLLWLTLFNFVSENGGGNGNVISAAVKHIHSTVKCTLAR